MAPTPSPRLGSLIPRLTPWSSVGRNALVLIAFLIFFAQLFHAGNDLLVGRHEDPETSPPGFGILGSLAILMIIGFGVLVGLIVGLGEQMEARRAGTAAVWRALLDHGPAGPPALQDATAVLPKALPPSPRLRLWTVAAVGGGIWTAGFVLDAVELYLLAQGGRSLLGALAGTFEDEWGLLRAIELPYALFWGAVLARYEARQLARDSQAEAATTALDESAVAIAVVRSGILRYASSGLERLLGVRSIAGEPAELGAPLVAFAARAEALGQEETPAPLRGPLELDLPRRGWTLRREGVAVQLRFDGLPSTALIFAPT